MNSFCKTHKTKVFGLSLRDPVIPPWWPVMSGVVKEWMGSDILITRASSGRVAVLDGKAVKRRDVLENASVISPVIALHGLRPTVDQIEEHVSVFFEMARPKGKPRATRYLVAWIWVVLLRNLRDVKYIGDPLSLIESH